MAIVMHLLDDRIYGPVVECDHCGKPIEKAKAGNVEWQVDENGAPRNGGAISFTHKQCCWDFENEHGGRASWYTSELTLFPLHLVTGLQINWQAALKQASESLR